jgi:hypothetical protein
VDRPVISGQKLLDSKLAKRRERGTVVLSRAVNRGETQLFEVKDVAANSPRCDADFVVLFEVPIVA